MYAINADHVYKVISAAAVIRTNELNIARVAESRANEINSLILDELQTTLEKIAARVGGLEHDYAFAVAVATASVAGVNVIDKYNKKLQLESN